jgi:hypothetical protein
MVVAVIDLDDFFDDHFFDDDQFLFTTHLSSSARLWLWKRRTLDRALQTCSTAS